MLIANIMFAVKMLNLIIIIIIIIIIIMSLFKEDDIFSTKTNLTYGPLKSKTYINIVIYICSRYDVWNTYQNMYICCS